MLQVNSPNPYTSHRGISLRLDYREGNLRRLGKAERLSSGALRLKANMTRTGVLEYDTGNELRPDNEVFDPESLASLRSAPVVIGHPPSGEVTLDTWKSLSVGHVEEVHRDGQFVTGTIIINDPDTIRRLEDGDLTELSPGYMSKVEPRTGNGPDGKPFTGVQKFIRYNHLALLPEGMGRSGSEVRVRTDSRSLGTITPEELRALLDIAESPLVKAMVEEDVAKAPNEEQDHLNKLQDQISNAWRSGQDVGEPEREKALQTIARSNQDYYSRVQDQISDAWRSK